MQLSNKPAKLLLPFAASGAKNTIPAASQIGIVAGKASLTDGFPPLTRTPLSAGGVPPSGLDMNGILYEISAVIRWANAGGGYPFDSSFATDANVVGYPKGARVMRSDGLGYWLNVTENNVTDPENVATGVGWVPDYTTGIATIAMASANVTLTPLQFGRPIVVITGTLTANLNLIFPNLAGEWTVVNSATGPYSVTCKTAAGTGVAIPTGYARGIYGDGTNVGASENADDLLAVNLANQTAAAKGSALVGYFSGETGSAGRTVHDKLHDSVNVKDFGALMSGGDDTAAYQAALNAALTVIIPPGTLIHSNIVVPAGRTIIGAGRNATVLKLKNGVNVNGHTMASVNDIEFQNLTLYGNSANNLTGGNGALATGSSSRIYFRNVRATDWRLAGIAAASGTSFVEAHACRIDSNLFDGFQCTTSDSPGVFFSTLTGNGRYGAVFGSGCTNVRDVGNIYKSNAQGGSIMVGGNDAIRLANLADTNGTGHGLQYNATVRGAFVGNISKSNGLSGLDFTLASLYGVAVGNISYANAIRGLEIDSGSYYNTAVGNVIYRNGEVGISVYRSPTTILIGNQALENGVSASPKYGIRLWDDLNTLPSSNCRLIGNNASDDRGGSATQTYGISIEAASTTGTVVNENKLSPNVTGGLSAVPGSISKARDNAGFVTQATGSGFFNAGDTAIVITHGLNVTPAARNINIALTNVPNTPVQDIWIDTMTSTQFTVHIRTAPGGSGLGFGWSADVYV